MLCTLHFNLPSYNTSIEQALKLHYLFSTSAAWIVRQLTQPAPPLPPDPIPRLLRPPQTHSSTENTPIHPFISLSSFNTRPPCFAACSSPNEFQTLHLNRAPNLISSSWRQALPSQASSLQIMTAPLTTHHIHYSSRMLTYFPFSTFRIQRVAGKFGHKSAPCHVRRRARWDVSHRRLQRRRCRWRWNLTTRRRRTHTLTLDGREEEEESKPVPVEGEGALDSLWGGSGGGRRALGQAVRGAAVVPLVAADAQSAGVRWALRPTSTINGY